VKYSESENKTDNFTVKLSFLFNSENSVIHSYLYDNNKLMLTNLSLLYKNMISTKGQ
jgi:hypothetical protein